MLGLNRIGSNRGGSLPIPVAAVCGCRGDARALTVPPAEVGVRPRFRLTPCSFLSSLQQRKRGMKGRFGLRRCCSNVWKQFPRPEPEAFTPPSVSPSIILLFPIPRSISYEHVFFLLNYTQTVSRPFIPEAVPPRFCFPHISLRGGSAWPMAGRHGPRGAGPGWKQPITGRTLLPREPVIDKSCRTQVSRVIVISPSLFPRLSILLLRSAHSTTPPSPPAPPHPILTGRSHWLPSASLKNDFVMRLVES